MLLTWTEVTTLELYDPITGSWFIASEAEFTCPADAHYYAEHQLDDDQRYRVVVTHYRSDGYR